MHETVRRVDQITDHSAAMRQGRKRQSSQGCALIFSLCFSTHKTIETQIGVQNGMVAETRRPKLTNPTSVQQANRTMGPGPQPKIDCNSLAQSNLP